MPAPDRADRPFDLVLFGATGFTGGLTAEYLAAHAPDGCRWALAGRSHDRLTAVRDRLAAADPSLVDLPLLTADVSDAASLRAVVEQTRVVVTTVGPYVEHGAGLVAACAEAGTDYADLTGESEFVDTMYVAHHARAVETGARLVHACGFDSIPADLGVLFTVLQLPEGVPVRIRGMLRTDARISGGTYASALEAFSRTGQMKQALAARRRLEPRPEGRRIRTVARRPHRDAESGYWLVPLPTIDPFVVKRSAAALERYGPDFSYAHYAAIERLPSVVGGLAGVGLLAAAAQVGPVRRRLLQRIPRGTGPSAERRARSSFSLQLVAEGGGRTVRTQVVGGDPGYTETAKMLGESGLCLAFDDIAPSSGQVTTAVAMGQHLIDRLVTAGLRFEVL